MDWLKGILLSSLAVLAPAKPLLVAAIVLTCLDTVAGILAARRRGEPITSAGLRRTITKAAVYTTAILAAHVGGVYLLEDALPTAKLVAGAIGVVESKSILENVETVIGKPIFSSLLSKLGSVNDPRKPDGP